MVRLLTPQAAAASAMLNSASPCLSGSVIQLLHTPSSVLSRRQPIPYSLHHADVEINGAADIYALALHPALPQPVALATLQWFQLLSGVDHRTSKSEQT